MTDIHKNMMDVHVQSVSLKWVHIIRLQGNVLQLPNSPKVCLLSKLSIIHNYSKKSCLYPTLKPIVARCENYNHLQGDLQLLDILPSCQLWDTSRGFHSGALHTLHIAMPHPSHSHTRIHSMHTHTYTKTKL